MRNVERILCLLAALTAPIEASFPQTVSPQPNVIHIEIETLLNDKGQVVCTLYSSSDGFPKQSEKALAHVNSPIADKHAVCEFVLLLGNVESQHRHAAQLNTHANGIAERWVGSCRRDLLDHVIAINEGHVRRLLTEYIQYHHEDRTHLGLGKGTPAGRIYSANPGRVISDVRLGGLHHRYDRAA
jgi:hypothetical protein